MTHVLAIDQGTTGTTCLVVEDGGRVLGRGSRPVEQRYLRTLADRKGAADARLAEYRWLLEELRVSLFAQELRTPQPVSVKRLDKAWQQLSS